MTSIRFVAVVVSAALFLVIDVEPRLFHPIFPVLICVVLPIFADPFIKTCTELAFECRYEGLWLCPNCFCLTQWFACSRILRCLPSCALLKGGLVTCGWHCFSTEHFYFSKSCLKIGTYSVWCISTSWGACHKCSPAITAGYKQMMAFRAVLLVDKSWINVRKRDWRYMKHYVTYAVKIFRDSLLGFLWSTCYMLVGACVGYCVRGMRLKCCIGNLRTPTKKDEKVDRKTLKGKLVLHVRPDRKTTTWLTQRTTTTKGQSSCLIYATPC